MKVPMHIKLKSYIDKFLFNVTKYYNPGLEQKGIVILFGAPLIKSKVGRIIIHDNVTLRSNNRNYFINMHSPTKIFTSTEEAKIIIGENCRINGACLHAYDEITIGQNTLIAANTQIFDTNRHELSFDNPSNRLAHTSKTKPVRIGKDVWIGANCIILPGVTIGNGSVIAAGSVVTKDIRPFTLNAGNPAREIRRYPIPEGYRMDDTMYS